MNKIDKIKHGCFVKNGEGWVGIIIKNKIDDDKLQILWFTGITSDQVGPTIPNVGLNLCSHMLPIDETFWATLEASFKNSILNSPLWEEL